MRYSVYNYQEDSNYWFLNNCNKTCLHHSKRWKNHFFSRYEKEKTGLERADRCDKGPMADPYIVVTGCILTTTMSQSLLFYSTTSFPSPIHLSILHLFLNPLSRGTLSSVQWWGETAASFLYATPCFYFPINHCEIFSLSPCTVVKLRQTLHFLRFILYVRGDVLHVQMFHSNIDLQHNEGNKISDMLLSYLNMTKVVLASRELELQLHYWMQQTIWRQ